MSVLRLIFITVPGSILRAIFIWWRGPTLGTLLATLFTGQHVGEDKFGNRYYESKKGRRWVIYNGTVEASRIPPDWHGWLHKTFKEPPTTAPFPAKGWEREHQPNLSGTRAPIIPRAASWATASGRRRPATTRPWKPE